MFQRIIKWLAGRHTMFAVYFTLVGTGLQWYHKLDVNFIMLIGAVQSFVLGHSIKEDWFAMKTAAAQQNGGSDNAGTSA